MLKHRLFLGISFLVLVALACGGSQSGGSQGTSGESNNEPAESAAPVHQVGEDVRVGDVRWKVTEVVDEGPTLTSDNQFIEDKNTSGKFIRVTFDIENLGGEVKTFTGMDVVDGQGREFKRSSDVFSFIPQDQGCALENLNPNIVKTCQAIYEVPGDATELKAFVGDLSLLGGDEAFISLGL